VVTNGAFEETAQLAQALKFAIRRGKNWEPLPPESKEALEQIASRIAMILNGDPNEAKHWNRIAMYARIRDKALTPIESSVAQAVRTRMFEPASPRAMRPVVEDSHEAS
jgi:hypothetical protein